MVGQLRGTASCRTASWHRDHRRNSQFPGEPSDEQVPTNALVTKWRGSPASGSLRRLQWHVRLRLRTKVPTCERLVSAGGARRVTPNLEPVPGTAAKLGVTRLLAAAGQGSLAGWKRGPKPEPRVP